MNLTDIERNQLGWIMLYETNLSTRTIHSLTENAVLTVLDVLDCYSSDIHFMDQFRWFYKRSKEEILQFILDIETEGLQVLYSKYGVSDAKAFDLWNIMSTPRETPGLFNYNIARNGLSGKLLQYLIRNHVYTLESLMHFPKNSLYKNTPAEIKAEPNAFLQKIADHAEECSFELNRGNTNREGYRLLKAINMHDIDSSFRGGGWYLLDNSIESFMALASFKYNFFQVRNVGIIRKQAMESFLQEFAEEGMIAIARRFLPLKKNTIKLHDDCDGEDRDFCKICRMYHFTCPQSFQSVLLFSDETMDWFREISLHDVGLSARVCNSLSRYGRIHNLEEFIRAYNNHVDFSILRNCGDKSVGEIQAFFHELKEMGKAAVIERLNRKN